jgi:hypothetical protein
VAALEAGEDSLYRAERGYSLLSQGLAENTDMEIMEVRVILPQMGAVVAEALLR